MALTLSALISFIISIVISFLSPRFTHLIWKKQKLREQQLAIAERFTKVCTNVHALGLDESTGEGYENWRDAKAATLEQASLLVLIPCIFEREEVQMRSRRLSELIKHYQGPDAHATRTELQALLFAEALDLPFERLKWLNQGAT